MYDASGIFSGTGGLVSVSHKGTIRLPCLLEMAELTSTLLNMFGITQTVLSTSYQP